MRVLNRFTLSSKKKCAKMCFAFCRNRLNKTLHSDEPQFLAYLDFTIFFIVYKENPFITVSKTVALCPPPSILPPLSRDLRNPSPVAEVHLKVLELIIGGCCPRSIFTRSCHEMQSPICWSHWVGIVWGRSSESGVGYLVVLHAQWSCTGRRLWCSEPCDKDVYQIKENFQGI